MNCGKGFLLTTDALLQRRHLLVIPIQIFIRIKVRVISMHVFSISVGPVVIVVGVLIGDGTILVLHVFSATHVLIKTIIRISTERRTGRTLLRTTLGETSVNTTNERFIRRVRLSAQLHPLANVGPALSQLLGSPFQLRLVDLIEPLLLGRIQLKRSGNESQQRPHGL